VRRRRVENLSFEQASGAIPTDGWRLAEEYATGIQKINEHLLEGQEIAGGVARSSPDKIEPRIYLWLIHLRKMGLERSGDNRFRLDDDRGVTPSSPGSTSEKPKYSICPSQAKRENFQSEIAARTEEGAKTGQKSGGNPKPAFIT